ncbi:hypothetical protein BLNAU_12960 [Blattamonas nauphoetae]|uniref:Uncharacterized protein n=1 Tax=Blattamonas nauphoetae TaxID=2049346 RepID=A0ABQ9XKW4_9EUKA|nr:hypothetical protein BLNAU_12960 [Blattamonas nauphoetae]
MGCGSSTKAVDNSNNNAIRVESVTFYRSDENGDPSQPVDGVFFTTDPIIHARCVLSTVLAGSYGRVVWVCNDSHGVGIYIFIHSSFLFFNALPPNYEIVSCNLSTLLMNVIDTHAELPRPWPVGEYELKIYINDNLLYQAPFKIVEVTDTVNPD